MKNTQIALLSFGNGTEKFTANFKITSWFYSATMTDPEDSGYEWECEIDVPDWVTDEMVMSKIESDNSIHPYA